MSLDALLVRLEGRAVTPATEDVTPDVTPRTAPMLACTRVTSVTAENDDKAAKAIGETLFNRAMEIRRPRELSILVPNVDEVFSFSPPGDPVNDDEALQERMAIMVEANGWDHARALQEARREADRERCWRAFLRNAARILAAPAQEREGMLGRYQAEAARRYGERTGTDMAKSLESWVRARGVH